MNNLWNCYQCNSLNRVQVHYQTNIAEVFIDLYMMMVMMSSALTTRQSHEGQLRQNGTVDSRYLEF